MPFFFVDQTGLKHPTTESWAYYGIDDPGVCERWTDAHAQRLSEDAGGGYAQYHQEAEAEAVAAPPGLCAGDIMTAPIKMIYEDQTLRTAATLFKNNGFGHLPVLNDSGKLVGVLSVRDIVNFMADNAQELMKDFLLNPVKVCMSPQALTVTSDTPIRHVVELMQHERIGSLPVLEHPEQRHLLPNQIWHESFDQGKVKLVGIITQSDVLSYCI